jgi:heme A synthase
MMSVDSVLRIVITIAFLALGWMIGDVVRLVVRRQDNLSTLVVCAGIICVAVIIGLVVVSALLQVCCGAAVGGR